MIFFNKVPSGDKLSISTDIIRKFNKSRVDDQNKILKQKKKDDLFLCYAPFNNIFFHSNGHITACCRSSSIFDEYPEHNLKDIWFGKKFELLRTPVKTKSFSVACNSCRYFLEKEDYGNVMSRIFDRNPLNKNNYPSVLEFELSNVCNLECIMCIGTLSSSIRKNKDDLPPLPMLYDHEFIEQLKDFIPFISEAKFYGGEPFLVNIYFEILDLIINLNPDVRITITTNGTVLNERIIRLFEKLKFNVNVSIDSVNKDDFEKIRKNADFADVLQNTAWFHEYCKKNSSIFCICINPLRQNWEEIPDMISYFNGTGALVSFNTVYDPPDCAIWNLESLEIENIYRYLSKFDLPEQNRVERHNKGKYHGLLNQIATWKDESYEKKRNDFKACLAETSQNV